MQQKPNLNPKSAAEHTGPTATPKQVDYMLILFNDLGYGTRAQIKGWLQTHGVGQDRQTLGLGDLTVREAIRVVDLLKAEKEDGRRLESAMSDELTPEDEEFWRE
jgi:hypothetical protein